MRVMIDVTAAGRAGCDRGIGRYLSAVRAANEVLGNEVVELVCSMGRSRLAEVAAMIRRVGALVHREFDLFHAPTAYYAAKDLRGRPTVTSVLDVIPLELDEHRKTGLKALLFHRLAAQADVVLTLSIHAASRIETLLGVDPQRIFVAPLPPAPPFVPTGPRAPGLTGHYVAMMVDLRTPDPRKRTHWIPTLATQLQPHGITLVVAGGGTEALRIPGIVGLGRIDDEVWASVLRGAEAFVYTSAYEGQGLPPLEAIACGTPVISMANTAIPEVIGDAGVLVDDHAGGDGAMLLAAEVRRVIDDPTLRSLLASECHTQSARFTPERFVARIGEAYAMAVARNS